MVSVFRDEDNDNFGKDVLPASSTAELLLTETAGFN